MIYAIAVFVLSMAAVLGAYWAFVVRPEASEKAQLSGRLKTFKVKSANISIEAAPDRLSAIPFLDVLVNTKTGVLAPLERLVIESGLKITVGTLLLMMLCGGAVGFGIGYWTGRLAVAAVLMLILGSIPLIWVKVKRNKRLNTFEEQFPEAVELIARSLRAGHAFTTGLGMAADEIKPPVGSEFKRVYDEQNFGMSLVTALRGMALRVPVLDARFFVTAVLTQRESGGNLSEVLDNLASVMRERFKVKRQIRVISAHGRISAWVLSGLAPGLAGVLFLLSPDFMRILWEDPMGLNLVMAAVVLQIIGTIIISRMVKIEYEMVDPVTLLMFGAIFLSTALATGTLFWYFSDPQFAQRRLQQMTPASGSGSNEPVSLVGIDVSPMARKVRSFVPKSPKDMGRIELMMAGAGYYSSWAATMYALAQMILPICIIAFAVTRFGTSTTTLIFAALAAAVGYYAPDLWLAQAIEKRKKEISNGLPDAIDLLIVCIESGSGIDQALGRVAEELALAYPALAREMDMIATETRAGKPRLEAFRNFADRTKVEDVRSLVAMLIQTDRFGTSIGQALRTHADSSRTKRRQRAEEKAAKLGVKLLFPLVFCLFPAFYLVVIGPSIIRIFREFVWGGLGK